MPRRTLCFALVLSAAGAAGALAAVAQLSLLGYNRGTCPHCNKSEKGTWL